jgi:hypothetical protein
MVLIWYHIWNICSKRSHFWLLSFGGSLSTTRLEGWAHAKLNFWNADIICPILVYSASSEPDLRKSFNITMFFLDTCVAWENINPHESTCWLHEHTNNDLASNLSFSPLLFLGKDCIGTKTTILLATREI